MLDSYLPLLKNAMTVLLFCVIVVVIRFAILKFIKKNIVKSKQAMLLPLNNAISLFFIILGVATILSNLGIKIDVLLGGVGIMSFVIGMALKDLISSFVSGVTIMLKGDIKVGDTLFFKDAKGRVIEVGVSSIIIQDIEDKNKLHVIKNNVISSECYSLIRGEANKKTKTSSTS